MNFQDVELLFGLIGSGIICALIAFGFYALRDNNMYSIVSSVFFRISFFFSILGVLWGNLLFFDGQELWGGSKYIVFLYDSCIFLSVLLFVAGQIILINLLYHLLKSKNVILNIFSVLGIIILIGFILFELPYLFKSFPLLTLCGIYSVLGLMWVFLYDYLKDDGNRNSLRKFSVLGLIILVGVYIFFGFVLYEVDFFKALYKEYSAKKIEYISFLICGIIITIINDRKKYFNFSKIYWIPVIFTSATVVYALYPLLIMGFDIFITDFIASVNKWRELIG